MILKLLRRDSFNLINPKFHNNRYRLLDKNRQINKKRLGQSGRFFCGLVLLIATNIAKFEKELNFS